MRIKKEIPMKIYREKLKIDNNLDMLLNLRSNRESKNNNLYNDSINNAEKPKSNGRINNKRFLTEKKILKLNYKELLRFNSSSDITNINTQNNSLNNLTQNELQNNIRLIISNRNSNYSKEINNTESNIRKKDLNKLFSHNLIKFEDRRKIKKLNSSKVLRLYQLYLQRKNQKFQIDELLPTDRTFSNKKIESEKNNLFSNYNNINHPLNKSFYNYSNISTYRSKQKSNKNKRKYNLNILNLYLLIALNILVFIK